MAVAVWLGIVLALCSYSLSTNEVSQESLPRLLAVDDQNLKPSLESVLDRSIETLSRVINFLKRVLVLATLLFLIENLINFWVLASSYAFLSIDLPDSFRDKISNIYVLYNESLFSYLGISIEYPDLRVSNQIYANYPNSAHYEFNFLKFSLEPAVLLTLAVIELTLIKWVIKNIKRKAHEHRQ